MKTMGRFCLPQGLTVLQFGPHPYCYAKVTFLSLKSDPITLHLKIPLEQHMCVPLVHPSNIIHAIAPSCILHSSHT